MTRVGIHLPQRRFGVRTQWPGWVSGPAFAELALPGIRHAAEETTVIVGWNRYEHGGHFAALEQPTGLVDDIRESFRTVRINRV